MMAIASHDFGTVGHHVSLEQVSTELRNAHFDSEVEAYDTTGSRLDGVSDTSGTPWLHLIARKPGVVVASARG